MELVAATGLPFDYVQELIRTLHIVGKIMYGDPERRENTGPPGCFHHVTKPTTAEAVLRELDRKRPVDVRNVSQAARPCPVGAVLCRTTHYGGVRAIPHDSVQSYELTDMGREPAAHASRSGS